MIQIYSALYNDLGQIVIICPYPLNHNLYLLSNNIKIIFNRYLCSHGLSTVFVLDNQTYIKKITLQLDNLDVEFIINLHKCESCKELLLMSTIIKNEDEYVIQWIEHHTILGIDKFIIYDNSGNKNEKPSLHLLGKGKNSNLHALLSNYVDSGRVIILDWPFEEKFQQTHQNHSIWAFKSAK